MATSNKNFKVKNGLDVNGPIGVGPTPDYGTTGQVLVSSGSDTPPTWEDASAGGGGISNVVEDTTPQLGGDLDTNGNDITNLNALTLDTTPTDVPASQGTLAWNPDLETLDIQLDTNVVLPVGQKHVIRVKNNSGSVAIPKGRAVSFAGATGDTVTVTPSISTSTYEPYTLVGVTSEEIPADGFGFVTQYGFVNNLNTDSWTLGDLLYVDPASPGLLTNSPPAAPNWTFPIAAVTRVHASTGRILVRTIPGLHLHDVVDVAISSPADNEVLAYSIENGVWINQTASESGLVAEGDARLTDSRTPTAHATSHGSAGADAITLNQSQVTNLTTDLGNKLALAGGTMTGKITLDGDPTQALHAVTKQYVDNVEAGLVTRPQVRAATTANLAADYSNGTLGVGSTLTSTSNGAFPLIDNVALTTVNGARGILVKNQTNAAHNGRYNLTTQGDAGTPWVLTRCVLCDEADEIPGSYIFVTDGDVNAGTGWVQNVLDPATFTVGTDNISVLQFSGGGVLVAGTNIEIVGNEISVIDAPIFAENVTGPTLRLTSTSEFDLFEDDHAFQVGPSNDVHLIIDPNNISTFQGGIGLAPTLYINKFGGDVEIAGGANSILLESPTIASRMITTNDGITNAPAKPALITSGYNSISGGPQQDSRLIMSATSTANTPLTGTCTISIASPAVITRTSHGHANGSFVFFTTTGALPTGLAINTGYYVVNAATNTFQVSATLGGTAINTSGTQSGTHTVLRETAPLRRPDGTALVVGDIWLGFV